MSSIGTIWTYPYNPRAIKVRWSPSHENCRLFLFSPPLAPGQIEAVAAMNGRTVDYAPKFAMGKTNKSPEFLADFPLGRVPTFKSAGGLALFESDAISQYAAECGPASSQLLGASAEGRAVIRQWISFADHELLEPLTTLILWRYGMASFDEEAEMFAFQHFNVSLAVLEKQLQGRQYIASEQLSLADISIATGLYWGFAQVIDKELRANYSRTTEWYLRVIEDVRVKSAFGEKNLIELRKTSPSQMTSK